jgi:GSH-dependent disulfide-bond oxidoreductase
MAEIEVHYWPTPNGHKVTMALEEMELAYRIVAVNIGRGEQFKPAFLAISPNNRMPAIVDPEGPDGEPVSVFESGAILQYLGRKTGKFYGPGERAKVEADQWVFWQMGGLGPMAGQCYHFRHYAPNILSDQRQLAYGANRYTNELHRLFGVLNRRLADRDYITGEYSIADMASYAWTTSWKAQGLDIAEFPDIRAWQERIGARDATKRAMARGDEVKKTFDMHNSGPEADKARSILFGQRAR